MRSNSKLATVHRGSSHTVNTQFGAPYNQSNELALVAINYVFLPTEGWRLVTGSVQGTLYFIPVKKLLAVTIQIKFNGPIVHSAKFELASR